MFVGAQQTTHARRAAYPEYSILTVADHIGEIAFVIALSGIKLGEGIGLRLKSGHATETFLQHRLIWRITIDRIGVDVDDCGGAVRSQ